VRSHQLETAITHFVHEAATYLQAELDAGAEVPFELESHSARGRGGGPGGGPQLYCYRPLTEAFIGERWQALANSESCAAAERLLECLQGLDRYLLQCDVRIGRNDRRSRATVVLRTLLEEVCAERTDFELDGERLRQALARLDATAFTNAGEVALIETLHGMGVVAPELARTRAPAIGRPELAWALARFEMGCERSSELEALSDHLLALRALLEPEGPASGLLAGRLAALCATPEERAGLTRRVLKAIALERDVITGAAVEHASCDALVAELAGHLRAVLRDVVCGHLPPDLVGCADSLLAAQGPTQQEPTRQEPTRQGPTQQEPTRQEPTRQGPTRQGPTRQEPTRQEPTRQEPTRQGPTRQGPPEPTHEEPIKARRGRRLASREPAVVSPPPEPTVVAAPLQSGAQPGAYRPDDQINTTIKRMRRLAARSGEQVPSDEVETGEILNVPVQVGHEDRVGVPQRVG
jgi:hypothetical protein